MAEPEFANTGPRPPSPRVDGDLFEPVVLLRDLRAEADGVAAPETLPDHLTLPQIVLLPDLFQPRPMNERHISELMRIIRSEGQVDQVVLFHTGRRSVLIDGHHRVEAYTRLRREDPVPVRFFRGTLDEAVMFSGRENSKAKLPMLMSERQDYAWRLVLLGAHSKEQIAAASGAARSQVGYMRQAQRVLGEDAHLHGGWLAARKAWRTQQGTKEQEVDAEWKEAVAADFADRLLKQFHNKLSKNPEIAALAFSMYFGRTLPQLYEALQAHLSDDELRGEEADGDDQF